MAPIALKDKKIERTAKQLVKCFISEELSKKNVPLGLQFALSNFRYHKFLDVDNNKVERTIKGLCEKFVVHGQGDKAKTLSNLCEKFVICNLTDDQLPEKSDTHYGLLQLLVSLSDSPVNAVYKEQLASKQDDTAADDFNWTKYLLDGEEQYVMHYHDSYELEEWTDSDEDDDSKQDEAKQAGDEVMENNLSLYVERIQQSNKRMMQIREVFSKAVVDPYWTSTDEGYSAPLQFSDSEISLASQWALYSQEHHPFGVIETRQELHEIQIVRETLWMLSGVKRLHVYTFVDGKFDVSDIMELSHITKVSLQKFLRTFADTATRIVELRDFIKDVSGGTTRTKMPLTFQAFGFAVLSYLKGFNERLSSLEELIIKKQEAITLSRLQHDLDQYQKEIFEIYHVFACGVQTFQEKENYKRVAYFLDVFYQCILLADGIGEFGRWKVELLLPQFLKSLEPYMEFLDGCLTEGKLVDNSDEFCIKKLADVIGQGPEIWTSALSVKDASTSCEGTSSCCPSFLEPVLQEIVVAGKSILLLESLSELARNTELRFQEDSLHLMFTRSVSRQPETRSMAELFNLCFYPHIRAKYKKSCSFLIQLLRSEYMLLDHLAALRNFFLLEAGDAMHHFYTDIFKKCSRRERWQDMSNLNSLLQEALSTGYQNSRQRLTVGYTKPPKITSDSFEGLELNYKAPWPVDLVIDDNSQKKYNDVFLFLLYVKRAKWSLDCLRFRDLESKTMTLPVDKEDPRTSYQTMDQHTQHRMHLLRYDLMQFVNGLHQYVMTRILHSKLEFNEALSKASDLDEIIKAHYLYTEKVLERCLMTNKVEVMRVGILKVLKLAVKFNKLWTFNIRQNRDEIITSISEDLRKWRTFIVTFLSKQIKQGSYPHLEALAFSLGSLHKTLSAHPNL